MLASRVSQRIAFISAVILLMLGAAGVCAQEGAEAQADSLSREGALKVYLEGFNYDYVRDNIPFVNYVRDVHIADLSVIVSYLASPAGGREYTVEMLGRGRYAGMNDTLRYFSGPTEVEDERKKEVIRTIKMGLMRYVARTPLAGEIDITCRRSAPPRAVADPWDSWIFTVGGSGSIYASQLERDYSMLTSLSASRVTEALKIDIDGSLSYREDETALTSRTLKTIKRYNQMNVYVAKSLTDHWSAGGFASAYYSTTGNRKSNYVIAPAAEYSVFPYREASFRTIVFMYRVDYCDVTYRDVTIYDKLSERIWRHRFAGYMGMARPWGSASGSLEWLQYFHDAGINSLTGSVFLSLRLFRGFNFNVSAYYTRDHDRIDQERRDLTDEEILLQLRRLAETYYYGMSLGFSYTFGSIYTNVVNPRFSL